MMGFRFLALAFCLLASQALAQETRPMPLAGMYAVYGAEIEVHRPKAPDIIKREDGSPPSVYLIGSSTMTGPAGGCLTKALNTHAIQGGVVGMCGLSSRILSKGGRYPCIGARAFGAEMEAYMDEVMDTSRYDKTKPFKTSIKGDLLHAHLAQTLKPDLIAFYLGDNEAGYLTKRTLRSADQKARYRKRLRSYLHLDTLVAQLPQDQACAIVTPTWVSRTTKAYDKTNEELEQLVLALSDEVAGRCHVIKGTDLMAKSEVSTFDGMHLGRKSACEFGSRAGNALARLLGKEAPALDQPTGVVVSITKRPLPRLRLSSLD